MTDCDVVTWAASGAMALTGPADGPPSARPAGVAGAATAAAAAVAVATAGLGSRVELDGPALLGERAAIAGLGRRGSVSVGGAARFERAADGWVVLNLPRPDDVAALPALLECAVDPADWIAVAAVVRARSCRELVDRGRLLGLAVACPDEHRASPAPGRELGRGSGRAVVERPLVIDLSSLWAGPLAGSILAAAGARVVKVEGRRRPDGARRGPSAFFDLLNADKEMLAIDFADRADIAFLRRLMARADLVIEASRPRAMDQCGIDPLTLAGESATSWISITGHGRVGDPDRVGFGDDAAVAGGLWVGDGRGPWFVADAVADPLTGMTAAAIGADLLATDRSAVVETPLVEGAARAAASPRDAVVERADGGGWVVCTDDERRPVAPPRARPLARRAAGHDAHGSALRVEFA